MTSSNTSALETHVSYDSVHSLAAAGRTSPPYHAVYAALLVMTAKLREYKGCWKSGLARKDLELQVLYFFRYLCPLFLLLNDFLTYKEVDSHWQ